MTNNDNIPTRLRLTLAKKLEGLTAQLDKDRAILREGILDFDEKADLRDLILRTEGRITELNYALSELQALREGF